MTKPLKKSLSAIPVEQAHGGSGSRQVLFSGQDSASPNFDAWTKGFLPASASYDWHHHVAIDEFFIVLQGTGTVAYEDGTEFDFIAGDSFCNPADLPHKITNTGATEAQFYFIRVKR